MPAPSGAPASRVLGCLFAAIAIGGCASGADHAVGAHAVGDPSTASSAPAHGTLTNREFDVAVAIARAEAEKDATTVTSATVTAGEGVEAAANAGPACTSGKLLHIKLMGTFDIVHAGGAGAEPTPSDEPVSAVLITADPESGKTCVISVQAGPATPDPGATTLFTNWRHP